MLKILSNCSPAKGSASTSPMSSVTRPASMAALFRRLAACTIVVEGRSLQLAAIGLSAASAIPRPAPKPSSRTRSTGEFNSSDRPVSFRRVLADHPLADCPADEAGRMLVLSIDEPSKLFLNPFRDLDHQSILGMFKTGFVGAPPPRRHSLKNSMTGQIRRFALHVQGRSNFTPSILCCELPDRG